MNTCEVCGQSDDEVVRVVFRGMFYGDENFAHPACVTGDPGVLTGDELATYLVAEQAAFADLDAMTDALPTPRLPSGEPNPYPNEDGSCQWCGGKRKHLKSCPLHI